MNRATNATGRCIRCSVFIYLLLCIKIEFGEINNKWIHRVGVKDVPAIIITNNPQVKEEYGDKYQIELIEGTYLEVLFLARDKVHEGHQLLTHPLSGSVKPNETPYKSLIVSMEKQSLHMDSLMIIEDSIGTAQKFMNTKILRQWNDEILRDFMEIDFRLISSGIESMRQFC